MAHDEQTPLPQDHSHEHGHDNGHGHGHPHDHGSERGPVADASVRVARVSDAPAVGLVQAVVYREAYAGTLGDEVLARFEPRAFTSAWRESLTNAPSRDHLLLVACAGEQVVGLAAVGPSSDPDGGETAELLVLAVHPEARRQGHGSRLLHAAVDTARGRDRHVLSAWVLATDDHTRAFLTAAGLETDGAHRERVVDAEGTTAREVRLSAGLAPEAE
ncbi:MAG TPA: GNAT family N-acetyltransferase [Humibacillus xanthopallidus]|nr:GNAT family N-acetyltransferase [Humibacillus xanthopallidus]